MLRNSWLAERLVASKEGFRSMDLSGLALANRVGAFAEKKKICSNNNL
jgi:hypothetical protein